MMSPKECSIGIDLGTANTCTAVFRNDKAEIVTHEGALLMPSYVAFNEKHRLVGSAAKYQAGVNPENTVFGALRLIGRKITDYEVQNLMTRLPFRVVEKNGGVAFVVRHRGNELIVTPVEVIAMILARARRDAQRYLGQSSPMTNAVITVPSYFNMNQRQAIWDAALIANVNPLRITSAAVSACTDFAVVQPSPGEHNVLVVDFGAGTLDAALMTLEENIIEIKAVASNLFLGGDDIDTRLMNHVATIFKRKTKLNPLEDPRALRRLRTACERAKEELSSQQRTLIEIDQLFRGRDLVSPINRKDLEDSCKDLIGAVFEIVERVLSDSKMHKTRIQTLLLTGGSSRMPVMQARITEYFGGKLLPRIFNPDETAARGAATYAAKLSGGSSKLLDELLLLDVSPLSIGIETAGGVMTPIIKRNSTIPTEKAEMFSTFQDNQTGFSVSVYEGERARVKDCNFLGQIGLSLPPAPRGVPQIELRMHYDANGTINVYAEHKGPGGEKSRLLLAHPNRLSQNEIAVIKGQAELLDASDAVEEERIKARTAAEDYVLTLLDRLASQHLTPNNVTSIRISRRRAEMLLEWLDANPRASTQDYTSRVSRLKETNDELPDERNFGQPVPLLPSITAASEWAFCSNEAGKKNEGSIRSDVAVADPNRVKGRPSVDGGHIPDKEQQPIGQQSNSAADDPAGKDQRPVDDDWGEWGSFGTKKKKKKKKTLSAELQPQTQLDLNPKAAVFEMNTELRDSVSLTDLKHSSNEGWDFGVSKKPEEKRNERDQPEASRDPKFEQEATYHEEEWKSWGMSKKEKRQAKAKKQGSVSISGAEPEVIPDDGRELTAVPEPIAEDDGWGLSTIWGSTKKTKKKGIATEPMAVPDVASGVESESNQELGPDSTAINAEIQSAEVAYDYHRNTPPMSPGPAANNYYSPRYGPQVNKPRSSPKVQGLAQHASHAAPPQYSYAENVDDSWSFATTPKKGEKSGRLTEPPPQSKLSSGPQAPILTFEDIDLDETPGPSLFSSSWGAWGARSQQRPNDVANAEISTPESGGKNVLQTPIPAQTTKNHVEPNLDETVPSGKVMEVAPGLGSTLDDEFHPTEEGNEPTTDASVSNLTGSEPALASPNVSSFGSELSTLQSDLSPSGTSRIDILRAGSLRDEPLRPETPRSSERGMSELFAKTKDANIVYTDADFNRITTYLKNVGRPTWSVVPRLYTVLRLVDQLDMLDTFVEQGITDIFFPFTPASLPNALSPTARAHFVDTQNAVLSKSLLFEKDLNRRHTNFRQDEPLPFQIVAILGSGAHGQVDKVMSTVSSREYARKRFRRRGGVSKDAIKSFLIELQVLKRVKHHHCIELVQSYTDPKFFALLMTPVGECNLYEYYDLAAKSPDKLTLLRSFFGCLATALEYIHSIKIRHRDIKPQNVLVKGHRVLLTDFGIALDWENLSRSTTTADSAKTLIYAAPEVMRYERRNTSADVWSLGCVFLEMVTVLKGETIPAMRAFFSARSGNYRIYANMENVARWANKLRSMGSEKDNAIFNWVRAMLAEDAKERLTAAEVCADVVQDCKVQQVIFCGSCCLEVADSSGEEDFDEEEGDLWGEVAEMTLAPEGS